MTLAEIILLGVVQGTTEFLPVSSSGHLLAARLLFNISDLDGSAFDAVLHIGTLAAVLVYYWRVWRKLAMSLVAADLTPERKLLAQLAIATVPAAVVGYFAQELVAEALRSPTTLAAGLFTTAGVLWLADWSQGKVGNLNQTSFRDALMIGLAQTIALIPGISRSGITIAAGLWRGMSRSQATKFSFLLSAPIIAGAGLNSMPQLLAGTLFTPNQLLLGMAAAFLSGLVAIHLLIRFVERISFTPFVWYLVALGGLILVIS